MYLFIDEQYRVYKHKRLSGRLRSLAMRGHLSVIHIPTMLGLNLDGTMSPVQDMPDHFEPDVEEANHEKAHSDSSTVTVC